MKLLTDTHAHTLVSGHAYSSMKEMAEAGQSIGLEALALTEHAPRMPGTCEEFYFQNLRVVPRELCGIKLLLGAELNITNKHGNVDLDNSILRHLDIVIASIHTPCFGESKGKEKNTNAYINAMKNPYINIIGHPDDGRFPLDYEKLVLAAKRYGVLLEVNNSSLRPTSFREHAKENIMEMLELCKQHKVSIAVGSDAHVFTDVGSFEKALDIIQICNFPEELIATTSYEKLRPYLRY